MRIAVPTDDKINISDSLIDAKIFKIVTIEKEKIVKEEFRNNNESCCQRNDNAENKYKMIFALIKDCSVVMINRIEDDIINYLKKQNLGIVITREKIMTNAVVEYKNEIIRIQSNTCCSP